MDKNNFGFKGLLREKQVFLINLKPKNLKKVFGQKGFETSWQFIETLT